MKKSLGFKLLGLMFSFTLILSVCNPFFSTDNENDFNIEKEDYLIRFTLSGPMLQQKYMFVLTPKKEILAEYVDENNKIEKTHIHLNEHQWTLIQKYTDTVLTLEKEDIENYYYTTDVWYTVIEFNDIQATFDYGISKSTAVNILLEQIIGCCDCEKSLKTADNLIDFNKKS